MLLEKLLDSGLIFSVCVVDPLVCALPDQTIKQYLCMMKDYIFGVGDFCGRKRRQIGYPAEAIFGRIGISFSLVIISPLKCVLEVFQKCLDT